MPIESRNPATGEIVRTYAEMERQRSPGSWGRRSGSSSSGGASPSPSEPGRWRARPPSSTRERDAYARLMAEEMGKPIAPGRAPRWRSAPGAATTTPSKARGLLAPEPVATDAPRSFVAFEPLGVVLAVMPWNFPFWQVFRFAAPALMAGNAGVLKHASNVPGCALAIEEVFASAGFPRGLFRTLLIGSRRVDARDRATRACER